jgi:hypothetical protein
MDHAEAIQSQAAEKYLLGEFSAEQQNEFAEHFLDCEECANDMRLTSLFMDTAKKVLAADSARPRSAVKGRYFAGYSMAASVALLAFLLYQNVVLIPKLRSASAPQALAYFSIANLGSRSAVPAAIAPIQGKPFILLVDIPAHENIDEYRCEILAPDGHKVISVDVPEVDARKTVPLLIPASALSPGSYTFTVSGRSKDGTSYNTELERYPLQVM